MFQTSFIKSDRQKKSSAVYFQLIILPIYLIILPPLSLVIVISITQMLKVFSYFLTAENVFNRQKKACLAPLRVYSLAVRGPSYQHTPHYGPGAASGPCKALVWGHSFIRLFVSHTQRQFTKLNSRLFVFVSLSNVAALIDFGALTRRKANS